MKGTQSPDATAAALIIGAEVLSGKVSDENGPFLIHSLRERGVRLVEVRVIDDVHETIVGAVRELLPKVDSLFTTGGIGPTHDDLTIPAIAAALDRPVVRHPTLVARLRHRYGDREGPHMRLAEVPEGAELVGLPDAIILAIRVEGVIILPGVPSLMRIAFRSIADQLNGSPLYSEALYLDASEAAIADDLTRVQHDHRLVAIGSYPRFDDAPYRVKITVDGRDADAVSAALAELRTCLAGRILDLPP